MTADPMDFVYLALILVLPVGALVVRRPPLGATVRMALAWVAIFGGMFVLVALWRSATLAGAVLGGLFQ